MTLFLIVFIFLVSFKVIERNCDRNLLGVSILTLMSELISYIPAIYHSKKIMDILNVRKKSSTTETMLSACIDSRKSLSDQFITDRKKQITAVISFYTLSLVIRTFLLFVSIFIEDSDLIQCQNLEDTVIITSDYFLGQFVLVLIEINQLLPHLVIPLAIFIIPMRR